eukprot:SAG11_NODE_5983_length_1419_cov_1.203030_2_plen_49_part_00
MMVQEGIIPDDCDTRIIEFSNCMQCLACILEVASICIEDLREAAQCVR